MFDFAGRVIRALCEMSFDIAQYLAHVLNVFRLKFVDLLAQQFGYMSPRAMADRFATRVFLSDFTRFICSQPARQLRCRHVDLVPEILDDLVIVIVF